VSQNGKNNLLNISPFQFWDTLSQNGKNCNALIINGLTIPKTCKKHQKNTQNWIFLRKKLISKNRIRRLAQTSAIAGKQH
jgi:hypothetical protein